MRINIEPTFQANESSIHPAKKNGLCACKEPTYHATIHTSFNGMNRGTSVSNPASLIISQDIQGRYIYIRTPAPSTIFTIIKHLYSVFILYKHPSHLYTNTLHDEASSHSHLDPSFSGTGSARGAKWSRSSCKLSINLSLDVRPKVRKRCTRRG